MGASYPLKHVPLKALLTCMTRPSALLIPWKGAIDSSVPPKHG